MIQKFFGERYGHKFVKGAIGLYPGNLVNDQVRKFFIFFVIYLFYLLQVLAKMPSLTLLIYAFIIQIREKLCIKSIPEQAKVTLIDEIAKENCGNKLKLNLLKVCMCMPQALDF